MKRDMSNKITYTSQRINRLLAIERPQECRSSLPGNCEFAAGKLTVPSGGTISLLPVGSDSACPQPSVSTSQSVRHFVRFVLLALLLMMAGVTGAWGQTDIESGFYYLENKQDNNAYYLVPAAGTGNVRNFKENEATPYLTTYKKSKATDATDNFIWYIEKVTDDGNAYYRFRHMLTGRYVVIHGVEDSANPARRRMHLETMQVPDDNSLFVIHASDDNSKIGIRHKSVFATNTNGKVYWWWDVSDGNKDNYSQGDYKGLLGLWLEIDDNAGRTKWAKPAAIEDAKKVCLPPVISYDDATQKVTISSDEDYDDVNFYYTTDDTEPTTSSQHYTDPFELTAGGIVKAIAVRGDFQNPTVTAYNTAQCAQPVLTLGDNGFTATCDTEGVTFYYTTDGTLPTTASTSSTTESINLPLDLTDEFLRVIAAKADDGSDASPATLYQIPQCAKPTITNNNGTIAISTTTDGATIHYRKDGKTVESTDGSYSEPYTYEITQAAHTITARTYKAGYRQSEQASLEYKKLNTPAITEVNNNGSVTITPNNATFYYTTSTTVAAPNNPNDKSTELKNETILLPAGTDIKVVKVRGYKLGNGYSDVLTYYVPTCNTPIIQRLGNTVTITCAVSSATIYYSTSRNGGFIEYTAPIETDAEVVRAYASCAGYQNSAITTLQDAQEVSSASEITEMGGSYKFSADFTVDSSIGTADAPFTGTIDGQLYTISSTVTKPLIAYAEDATVRNVIFKSVNIPSTTEGNVGAIVSNANGKCRIYNCGVLGTLTEIKDEETGAITAITSSSKIGGKGDVGSIVGRLNDNSRVVNCYSYAEITDGTNVAGIVGNNNTTTDIVRGNVDMLPMIVNCMFYGEITGGTTIAPVYGGRLIKNNGETGINLYDYFRSEALFDNNFGDINNYKRSWPAEEKYLTRFEYYRNILNSNRHLCTYWVTGKVGTEQTAADTALIAKWVLDPGIAPYPILKKWGRYPSVINQDPEQVWNPQSKRWVNRTMANDYEGKYLGRLSVTINAGDGHAGSGASSETRDFIIMDMDTLNNDYCYGKIQLPYYNEVFGNPTVQIPDPSAEDYSNKWNNRYGGNYTAKVVTGWKITAVTDDGRTRNDFVAHWEYGYNFADRNCTEKDLFIKSGRVFAQGGYYYVPEGVTAITIEAYWGDARYLRNADNSIDRVNVTAADQSNGSAFTPAGSLPSTMQGLPVYNYLPDAIKSLGKVGSGKTVYDQAIVLVGNFQRRNGNDAVGNQGDDMFPYTLMSADFDLDNEPDFCMQLQFRSNTDRIGIQPVRYDFVTVPELGLAIRPDNKAYAIGIMAPLGHFEITETAFMHTTQFEYDGATGKTKTEAPLILNGGHFEQIVVRMGPKNRTSYIQMGGHFWMKRFTPGWHVTPQTPNQYDGVRHCAVSVMGGEFPEFYLSGIYKIDDYNYSSSSNSNKYKVNTDNPHCYVNGGRFGIMVGAGYETVDGDVTFKIDHAVIDEFYGGGINGSKPVRGSIDVTINHSLVGKYCGGPKVGSMLTGKTVTTRATGTVFGEYFGGGNGGTSYYRETKKDETPVMPAANASGWSGDHQFQNFNPLNTLSGINAAYDDGIDKKGYHAEYEFELFNSSNGTDANIVKRSYYHWAQFGTTMTGTVSNTLTDCTVNSNFYGGGNLGNVNGDVTSILNGDTKVHGSAYAAGFSASIPHFPIHDKASAVFPTRDFSGVITDGHIPYVKDGTEIRNYTWCYKNPETGVVSPAGVEIPSDVSTNNVGKSTFQYEGKWYCYTTISLEHLGTVSGNASIEIGGDTEIGGSVYGGGDESAVDGNTTVTLKDNAEVHGDVFGGGNKAEVQGNTTVKIPAATSGTSDSGSGSEPESP